MKKRIITTLLAAAMTAAFATPALATEEGVEVQSQVNNLPPVSSYSVITQSATQQYVTEPRVDVDGSGNTIYNSVTTIDADNNRATNSMDTVLNGTIQATQLKVTVPAAVFFVLDPTYQDQAGLDNHMTQAVQPDIYITNESLVPVYAKISELKASEGANNDNKNVSLKITNDVSQIYNQKTVMFAFKEKMAVERNVAAVNATNPNSAIGQWENKSDWLMAVADQETISNKPYLLTTEAEKGRIDGLTYTNGDKTQPVADKLDMKIYIRTSAGWHVRDTITLTPTIVISVLDYATIKANQSNGSVIHSTTGNQPAVVELDTSETGSPVAETETDTVETETETVDQTQGGESSSELPDEAA